MRLKRCPTTNILIPEIWIKINNYGGWYEVSNYGRVRSWKKQGIGNNKREHPKMLSPGNVGPGYPAVVLHKDGFRKTKLIHRLVGLYFIPNPDNKPEINHINGDKEDNFCLNIEWSTSSENSKHAFGMGLCKDQKGEENGYSKLTNEDVIEIREKYKTGNYYQRELGEMYNISRRTIGNVVNRTIWTHI